VLNSCSRCLQSLAIASIAGLEIFARIEFARILVQHLADSGQSSPSGCSVSMLILRTPFLMPALDLGNRQRPRSASSCRHWRLMMSCRFPAAPRMNHASPDACWAACGEFPRSRSSPEMLPSGLARELVGAVRCPHRNRERVDFCLFNELHRFVGIGEQTGRGRACPPAPVAIPPCRPCRSPSEPQHAKFAPRPKCRRDEPCRVTVFG